MIFKNYITYTAILFICSIPISILGEPPSTVIPVPSTLKKFMPTLHEEKLMEAKNRTVDFVMIGDSITHAWSKYPDIFSDANLLNLGFPGDRTQNVLWRIQNGAIDGISPTLVTLMIGTNNVHESKELYPPDKIEDIILGIKAIVAEVEDRLPESEVVIISVLPRQSGPENDKVKAINAILPQFVDGKRVSFFDLNPLFLTETGKQNKSLFKKDLLHLNDQGYGVWALAMKPLLARYGLKMNLTRLKSDSVKSNL